MSTDLAKTSAIPDLMAEEYESLRQLQTSELKAQLTESLHLSAAYLRRLATIVRLLEDRGEDLSDLKIGLLPYLRLIAHGQILPELVVRHGQSPGLLRMARSLPLPDQHRLAMGERIPVVFRREDGTYDHRLIDPVTMGREHMHQVFSLGRIRPIEEQIAFLESRAISRQANKPELKPARLRPDRDRGGIIFGRSFIPTSEILEALSQLRTESDAADDTEDTMDAGRDKMVNIKLTEEEHRQLAMTAIRGNTRMNRLVRRALMAYGLI